jgi:uncharacterized protein (TIGR00645 family)
MLGHGRCQRQRPCFNGDEVFAPLFSKSGRFPLTEKPAYALKADAIGVLHAPQASHDCLCPARGAPGMRFLSRGIEAVLFGGRMLLVPIYLAMLVLLAMLMVYFVGELIHAMPSLPGMSEKDLIILTVSLVDLSLTANLVVLVILSGYENFVRRVTFTEDDVRPAWLVRINFTGLKLRLLGTITAIAAVHLLGSFLEVSSQNDRDLFWQVVMVLVFPVLGLLLALTDRLSDQTHEVN